MITIKHILLSQKFNQNVFIQIIMIVYTHNLIELNLIQPFYKDILIINLKSDKYGQIQERTYVNLIVFKKSVCSFYKFNWLFIGVVKRNPRVYTQ